MTDPVETPEEEGPPGDPTNFIEQVRRRLGLRSRKAVADKMGVSEMSVKRWEEGGATIRKLNELAKTLGVYPSEFLTGPPPPAPLPQDEVEILDWFRKLGPSDRRSILIQTRALAESEPPEFKHREAGKG